MYHAEKILSLPPMILGRIPLRESKLAAKRMPVREHRYRPRTMTLKYHQRVQKKWAKRWGYEHKPAAYFIDLEASGVGLGQALVCHPTLAARIREAFGNVS